MKAYTHYRATALLTRLLVLHMLSGCFNTSKQLSIPNRKYDDSAIFATSSTLPFRRFTCLMGVTFMFFAGWLGYGINSFLGKQEKTICLGIYNGNTEIAGKIALQLKKVRKNITRQLPIEIQLRSLLQKPSTIIDYHLFWVKKRY